MPTSRKPVKLSCRLPRSTLGATVAADAMREERLRQRAAVLDAVHGPPPPMPPHAHATRQSQAKLRGTPQDFPDGQAPHKIATRFSPRFSPMFSQDALTFPQNSSEGIPSICPDMSDDIQDTLDDPQVLPPPTPADAACEDDSSKEVALSGGDVAMSKRQIAGANFLEQAAYSPGRQCCHE